MRICTQCDSDDVNTFFADANTEHDVCNACGYDTDSAMLAFPLSLYAASHGVTPQSLLSWNGNIDDDDVEQARELDEMESMREIRATLLHFARLCAFTRGDDMDNPATLRWFLQAQGIESKDVLDWVLRGKS